MIVFRELRLSFMLFVLLTLLTGLAYPFLVLGIGQKLFPAQANGSLIVIDGRVLGSSLIAQGFSREAYFHARPSAAGNGYDASNSSGTNESPTSADLIKDVHGRVELLKQYQNPSLIPVDLVTSSASGLDPDISVAAALYQVVHIAETRHMSAMQINDLITKKTTAPDLGFLGESRVNVLDLNRALDQLPVMSTP